MLRDEQRWSKNIRKVSTWVKEKTIDIKLPIQWIVFFIYITEIFLILSFNQLSHLSHIPSQWNLLSSRNHVSWQKQHHLSSCIYEPIRRSNESRPCRNRPIAGERHSVHQWRRAILFRTYKVTNKVSSRGRKWSRFVVSTSWRKKSFLWREISIFLFIRVKIIKYWQT